MRGYDNNQFENSLEDGMKPWARRETDEDWLGCSSVRSSSFLPFLLSDHLFSFFSVESLKADSQVKRALVYLWTTVGDHIIGPNSSFLSDFVVLPPAPWAEWQNIISYSLNLGLATWHVLFSDMWVKGQCTSSDSELVFPDPELVVWFLYHHYKKNIPTLGRRSTDDERHMECGCPNQPTDLQWELPRCLKQSHQLSPD